MALLLSSGMVGRSPPTVNMIMSKMAVLHAARTQGKLKRHTAETLQTLFVSPSLAWRKKKG
jgi:hypothetical protein